MTPEMHYKIQEWRQKAREGTMTLEDTRDALAALRADRAVSAATSAKAKTASAKAKKVVNSDDLLGELDGL